MDLIFAISLIAVLILGAAAGYFVGTRPVGEWKSRHEEAEGKAKEGEDKFKQAVTDLGNTQIELATEKERAARADGLFEELTKARGDREGLTAELATLKANAANFDEQKQALVDSKDSLLKEFQLTGAKVLEQAQDKFAQKAKEQFGQSEKANKEAVASLLKPVDDRLKSYEQQVQNLEKQRIDAFGSLRAQIDEMQKGQQAVQAEAMKLSSALTAGPKARGRWGEQQLKNLLEQCGLAEHTDFMLEHSVETEEGRLRPDAIVKIPGGKMLVIDSKVSLNAYQEAAAADNEEDRARAMTSHVTSMKTHIQALGAKSYQSQFEDAPDYVVMFVPGEHFVSAALDHEPELWNFAFERKVLLATPTNLVALARTVAQVWRQDALAAEARDIGRMGTEIYDRIAVAAEHLKRVGGGLESAVKNYNKFVGSFERNVLSAGRKLKEKGIEIGKREIEETPLVESSPNYGNADVVADEGGPSVDGGGLLSNSSTGEASGDERQGSE